MTQILLALIAVSNLVIVFTKASASAARVNEIFETSSSIIKNTSNELILNFKNNTYEESLDLNTNNKIDTLYTDQHSSKSIHNILPKFEFKNVSFSYEASEKYSLENILIYR